MAEVNDKIVNQNRPDSHQTSKPIPAPSNHMESSSFDFYEKNVRPCLVECSGVAMFVFVGCMAVQNPLTLGPGGIFPGPSAVCVALAHGLTIALLIIGTGHISGGHFNPAVTLGVSLAGGIKPILAVGYVFSQLIGSLVGAGLVKAVLPAATYAGIGAGAHDLGNGVTPGGGILCEMVLTSVLVLTVLVAAVDRDDNVLAPLGIGLAVAVDILAGIATTGASMNPARSFGPAVVVSSVNSRFWTHHYVYWVGPALGSLVAAAYYRFLIASPNKRLVLKGPQSDGYEDL